MAFSKKWLATCMTPEACWLIISLTNWRMSSGDVHDGNVGALLHLECGIHEAVLGYPGVGIDEEDDFTPGWSAQYI
jgi:hypothetical protein